MQKEIENLKKEEITKQLDKLVLSSMSNYETESDGSSSYGDETDAFDESLENDLGKVAFDSEDEVSLKTEEEVSLEEEEAESGEEQNSSEEQDEEQSEDQGKEQDEQAEQSDSSMAAASSFPRSFRQQKEDEYIMKLKEIQGEVFHLKEMIEEFARDIKASMTELIFEQFSQLESGLLGDDEPENSVTIDDGNESDETITEANEE